MSANVAGFLLASKTDEKVTVQHKIMTLASVYFLKKWLIMPLVNSFTLLLCVDLLLYNLIHNCMLTKGLYQT